MEQRPRQPLVIAISGASGLIGSHLRPYLTDRGHRVIGLIRDRLRVRPPDVYWNPETGEFEADRFQGVDAIVHLAGANLAAGRWTAARKAEIRDSRVRGTRLLCEGLARLARPPGVLVAASAIGYYGDGGAVALTEDSPVGGGFLADLVRDWEAATGPARDAGLRVVNLRLGMVLSAAGGALPRMLPPFRWGLGGRIGHGRQYVSWMALADVLAAIEYLLDASALSGPVNVVSPTPVTNANFAATLARVLRRPALLPIPAAVVRVLFGQMGRELLLASTRVLPARLVESGFAHAYAELEAALRAALRAR
jgi:hypothetical protein